MILLDLGELQRALEQFQQVGKMESRLKYGDLALTLFKLGRTNEARATIDSGIKESKADRGGLFASVRAILYAAERDQDGAERVIAQARTAKSSVTFITPPITLRAPTPF